MNYLTTLSCVSCGHDFKPEDIDYTCPACGPLFGTLQVNYDYAAIKKTLNRKSLQGDGNFCQWRYLPVLPVSEPHYIQPLALGWTPLYRCDRLAQELGFRSLWLKDDTRNPTASYKDRASAVAVVKALEKGSRVVTAASTGNAASSLSAFAALAGLQAVIFVPENAPRAKVTQLLLYGSKVIKVRGTYDDAFELCGQAAEKWGWYNRSTAINPYLGEGKKTGALEVCEQLNWQPPDYVFVSVGDGCIFQGLWKGFCDFYQLGLIERLPKMIGVQAAGSAPLVKAWQNGAAQAEPLIPHTLADSIAVGVPRDQIKALKAARASGGRFVAVPDDKILEAIVVLARRVGIMAEPAGAAAFAGLQQCAREGLIHAEETAVVFATGHGLKDIDGVLNAVDATPLTVNKSLANVIEALGLGN